MHSQPAQFEDVQCLLACQPLSVGMVNARILELTGLSGHLERLDREIHLAASLRFRDMSPNDWARSVRTPTLVYQVHDDLLTRPIDVQTTYDNIPIADKKLHWIRGTNARWDGYLEFQRRPKLFLDWLEVHMR